MVGIRKYNKRNYGDGSDDDDEVGITTSTIAIPGWDKLYFMTRLKSHRRMRIELGVADGRTTGQTHRLLEMRGRML